jgi:hypothetical protein
MEFTFESIKNSIENETLEDDDLTAIFASQLVQDPEIRQLLLSYQYLPKYMRNQLNNMN